MAQMYKFFLNLQVINISIVIHTVLLITLRPH